MPAELKGRFGLVTNFGTTEHIANQLNAFKVIHDLAAVHGVMMHHLPAQGMLNHGLVNYNPKFFWMLARSNGYKWLYADYVLAADSLGLPANIVDQIRLFEPDIAVRAAQYRIPAGGIRIALQKIYDLPYVAPLDVDTGSLPSYPALAERYWTVFTPDAFDRLNRSASPGRNLITWPRALGRTVRRLLSLRAWPRSRRS